MADSMLRQEIEVYSEKYDIKGVIKDYGMVTKLSFSYGGRDIEMGIDRNPLGKESFEVIGQQIIDSYISNLAMEGRKITLHYWYIEEHTTEMGMFRIGHGIVTGHPRISDACDMHTSNIRTIFTDFEKGELVVTTMNNEYHCPLEYCRWKRQDEYAHVIPDYEEVKERYMDKIQYPSIEPGKVLLVLANFCEYYFHSLYYVPLESKDNEPIPFHGYPHVGMFQDSYLIGTDDTSIDLRYFPHFQNVKFYCEHTDNMPFFIENIGDVVLCAKTSVGTIKIKPGERKQVIKENAEDDTPILPGGDLYPAGIME